MAVHQTIDGSTRDELVVALGYWRGKRQDIKRVWTSGRWDERSTKMTGKWEYEVSKVKLAEALWPNLEQKIDQVKASRRCSGPAHCRGDQRCLSRGTAAAVSLFRPH